MIRAIPQICILGGGFGGLYTALYLNRYRWSQLTPQITLIDQRDYFLFTPLLYELVTEELQLWEIAPTFKQLLARTNIRFYQATVQGVDLEKRQVQFQGGGVLFYDRLALAVGRTTRLDMVPGAATYAYPFRTLTDVERLQERLRSLETRNPVRVVIAGGGPSGVELACKLADRLQERGQLCLIDRGKQILQDFSLPGREAVYRALATRGIQVELETSIKAVDFDSITLVHEGQDKTIPVDLVVWTIGTQTWEWVHTLTCQRNSQDQLLTLPTLQLLDYSDVFSLGDSAETWDVQGKLVPATAQAASQQAKVAARNLRASLIGRPLLSFRYCHLGEMLTLGKNAAVVSSFGLHLEGGLAYLVRQWIYLLRMPTLYHRLQIGRHWLVTLVLQGLASCWRQAAMLLMRLGRKRSVSVHWQRARSVHRQHPPLGKFRRKDRA